MRIATIAVVSALAAASGTASGAIHITEWAYQGGTAEFIEITNTGSSAVDLAGWSFDDDSRAPGTVMIGSLGVLAAGESAIIADISASAFRAAWNLSASVKVFGGNTTNLGRDDEINIFDQNNNLVDRLTYGDGNFPGSIRTNLASGNIPLSALGLNNVMAAVLSTNGDAYGSFASTGGQIANPGSYSPIPTPGTLALAAFGGLVAGRRRRA